MCVMVYKQLPLIYRCEMDESILLQDIRCYGRVKGLVIAPIEMKPMSEAPDVGNDVLESSAIVTSLCSAQPFTAGLSVLSSSHNYSSLSKLPLIKQGTYEFVQHHDCNT
jgi:hypothetical protein